MLSPFWDVRFLPEIPLAFVFSPGVDQQRIIKMVSIGGWALAFMLGLGLPAAAVFPCWGFRKIGKKRYIENIPASATVSLAYGPAELKNRRGKRPSYYKGR